MDNLITTELFDLYRYNHAPKGDVVIYITSKDFDGGAGAIFDTLKSNISFYELRVANWDDNLTPWAADAKMKGRTFGGKASSLLKEILNEVMPLVRNDATKVYIAGYSLAGLFSLWTLYESDVFDGCACCSGSLWYPGWVEYAKTHQVRTASEIYLSVGNREKNSKNEFMKHVEEAYATQLDFLDSDVNVSKVDFTLCEGGHFNDVHERVVKGVQFLINR
ncbi:MAG: hypothetical protein MJ093_00850 [Saccharofermentans sp.]|nr:hypothetical protein [Saccharofermentans sp.]